MYFTYDQAIFHLKNMKEMATATSVDGNPRILLDIWSEDDFAEGPGQNLEEELGRELTVKEIRTAMRDQADKFEADRGINWDTIEASLRFAVMQK